MSAPRRKAKQGLASSDSPGELNAELLAAAYAGDEARVRDALEQGADIGAKDPRTGMTALHLAVGNNHLSLTRYLVEKWKAPFGPDGFGRWPSSVAGDCEVSIELGDFIAEHEKEDEPKGKKS